MNTRSAKAKGKRLENYIKEQLIAKFNLTTDDIRITIGNEKGEDIVLSKSARRKIPFKFEAKARQSIAVFRWYDQCCGHKGEGEPLLVIKANRTKPLAVLSLNYLLELIKKDNNKNGTQ